MITIGSDNNGEIAFGALQAGLDLSYSPSIVHFTWDECDEMDEVTGDGHAELLDDGSIEITSPTTTATKPSSRQYGALLDNLPVLDLKALDPDFGDRALR